jgi:amino acid adenylation domain-containing protein
MMATDYYENIAELSLDKQELLSLLLSQEADKASVTPLSFAQQRLWFIEHMGRATHVYNICTSVRLQGRVNEKALERSFNEIVRRHEGLRTTFELVDEEPVQIVAPVVKVKTSVISLEALPAAGHEAEVQRLVGKESQTPFDLARGPLLRVTLLRLSANESVLMLTMHHIIADGWSMGVLVHEMVTLYEAFSQGKPSPLSELSIQYPDFVLWQREQLQGETLEQSLAYWKQQLNGAPAGLELPKDYPRPLINNYRGAKQSLTLSAELSNALKTLSEREGVTLFMTLLAAFKTLCYRYTGQTDLVIGTPIANRNRAETEPLIGFFVNTLLLRTDVSDDPTFANLLRRVREVSLEAYAHQDLPFEKLVEELRPERSLSQTPLFQVMFVLQNAPMDHIELPGLTLSPMTVDNGTAKFDLTLFLEVTDAGIVGTLEYSTDLFASATIERMAGHYQRLLEAVVSDPDQRLSRLALLTTGERQQQLVQWNDDTCEYPAQQSLHELFEAQVERDPEAVAVVCGEQQLSYAELNSRANQLAHYLREKGVKPEVLVGLLMERSLDLVVALLGILKAGGAYLPLDPVYPRERLSFMMDDAGAKVLLTETQFAGSIDNQNVEIVCLDDDWQQVQSCSSQNPASDVTPHNAAYVIYTSGSTGKPKGVVVSHHNVTRLLAATQSRFNFNQQDVWTMFHSYAFDFSVWEIWGALAYGGELVVIPYSMSRSPEEFYETLKKRKVTVLNQTPSAFRQLIQAEQSANRVSELSLRWVIFGGEALELQSLKPWLERHGDVRPKLVNMYGITETTVHVTYREISRKDVEDESGSVIGSPIGDLQVYVLNEQQELAPIGVAGEMYVGGGGVARGYLKRADLTADRFIPRQFSRKAGQRLYRTGDLARRLSNGDLEYLGRIDHQVKVRGYRIELGEIEAVLREHSEVQDAVVIASGDTSGDKRLIGYLIMQGTAAAKAGELRRYLGERLPDYMVPQVFVQLDEWPLTPSGKLDQRSLPTPELERSQLHDAYVAPQTHVEQMLAAAWAEVLRVKQVGVNDNYFELGGDSIRSVSLVAAARKRGVSFSLEQLFRYQTIAELVKELEANDSQYVPTLNIEPFSLILEEDRLKLSQGIEDAYPLTKLQAGMIFHMEYSPGSAVYQNVSSYHLRASFDEAALETAVRQLIGRHPVLRTSFDLTSYSEPLQLVHEHVSLPIELEDLRHLSGEEQEQAIAAGLEIEKSLKFDSTQPPLLRFRVQRRTDTTFQFTLTEHHAILDGWSAASLLAELFNRYFAILKGDQNAELPLNGAFREFVALEREILKSEEARDYWSRKLSGSTVTMIPRWSKSGELPASAKLIHAAVPISSEISDGLKNLAHAAGVPLKSVLLAAYLRVMSLVSVQQDVVTGLVSHGRPEGPDGERVLGLYLNTLPFRLKLSRGSWIDLARETFDTERELLPYRRYPMAQIQNQQGHTLFETFFNFVNFHVYDGLEKMSEVEVLGGSAFADTNYTLSAEFSLDKDSSNVTLMLSGGGMELGREQMSALRDYFAMTLATMSHDPTSDYSSVCLLPPAERRQIVEEWNQTERDYEAGICLHEMFELQVVQTPGSVALICDDQQLSYTELNRRANQLAHYLISLGVSAESRVGIMMHRSPEMLISMLAVLKANGAYVPLDSTYPEERLSFMLDDAEVEVLLTQADLQSRAPHSCHAKVVCLEAIPDILSRQPHDNPYRKVLAENLAYVIYTSGSTGVPKGVAIAHKSASALLHWAHEEFTEAELARVLASTSINFDLSVFELFVPLSMGGTVQLVANALVLPELPEKDKITLINTVPSAIAELMRMGELPASLSVVNLAGEPLTRNLVQRIYDQPFVSHVVNLYGPSEDTTYSTCAWVSREANQPVTIGRPIANSQIYLLDASMQPVPLGATGEIYIGGDGLARGYLRRPQLTAEKFVPDLFSQSSGKRLYSTGDVARYLANGEIEFLGRLDHQIKLRGFRIELGEIEAALESHPSVSECAVLMREDTPGDQRLVAYLVAHEGSVPAPNELRALIKKKLPEYMLPSVFVMLEEMPLTLNGKIDRKRLPMPDQTREAIGQFVAPRTAVEEILSGIWMQVLGVKQVGVRDNFFEIGGHSLLATQVISRVRETFRTEISLRSLFEAPTIEALAGHVEAALRGASALPSPLVAVAREEELPLSFAQQRLWFLDQVTPGSFAFNIGEAMRLEGELNVTALELTLNEVTRRHEVLRTTFHSVNGQARQVIAPALKVDLPVVDLTKLLPEERESEAVRLAELETQVPFDLAHGPLVRARLLRLAEDDHVFLFTMHHIVSDAWSMGVLAREVTVLYKSFLHGEPSPLPDLPLQYADFAHWQREWLQDGTLDAQLPYWRGHLAGAPSLLDLPTDRPRKPESTFSGARSSVSFPQTLTESLKALSHKEGSTLFMTLLAAYNVLLHYYSGKDDILVGTDVANRNRLETELLIGYFVNQLVLRGRVTSDSSFHDLLVQIREMTLAAYAHQDLPFDRLLSGLKIVRSAQHLPLFQVKLVYQNAPLDTLELPGLSISSLGLNSGMSRFDLQLSLWEESGNLRGWFEYNADLFDVSTIEMFSEDLAIILHQVAAEPGILIGELVRRLNEARSNGNAVSKEKSKEALSKKYKTVRRRAVSIAGVE